MFPNFPYSYPLKSIVLPPFALSRSPPLLFGSVVAPSPRSSPQASPSPKPTTHIQPVSHLTHQAQPLTKYSLHSSPVIVPIFSSQCTLSAGISPAHSTSSTKCPNEITFTELHHCHTLSVR